MLYPALLKLQQFVSKCHDIQEMTSEMARDPSI
jgi:hypothetical protein